MKRDDLRLMGYGKFASTCIETGTVDVQKMLNFTEGVLFGFDLGTGLNPKKEMLDVYKMNDDGKPVKIGQSENWLKP
jgi:hypothetical protein